MNHEDSCQFCSSVLFVLPRNIFCQPPDGVEKAPIEGRGHCHFQFCLLFVSSSFCAKPVESGGLLLGYFAPALYQGMCVRVCVCSDRKQNPIK